MKRIAYVLILALVLVGCGDGTSTQETADTAASAAEAAPVREDIAAYCAVEHVVSPIDPDDPESYEAGMNTELAVMRRHVELAPPEIEEEISELYEAMETFVADLEAAGWNDNNLGPGEGILPEEASAAVIEFDVEHCGELDPRCNPGSGAKFCTEEQLAEFKEGQP